MNCIHSKRSMREIAIREFRMILSTPIVQKLRGEPAQTRDVPVRRYAISTPYSGCRAFRVNVHTRDLLELERRVCESK